MLQSLLRKLTLHLHFEKLPKQDNIYLLCLWNLDEHNMLGCLILGVKY